MKHTLEHLMGGGNLSLSEAEELLAALTDEEAPPAMAGAVLAALRTKGETPDEICGFAKAMRRLAKRPNLSAEETAIDIVGTGGDGSGSLNLSTGSALLAAACGLPVVKHGNRSITSKSGSADVLEALGLSMPLDEDAAARCLERTGFTFLFAPYYHPAMKAVAPIRRSLGVRTAFNMLGPLTNPAEPPYYLIGAFSLAAGELMAGALSGLPLKKAFVIHGAAGWDEATPIGPFTLFDVGPGTVEKSVRDPVDYGLPRCTPNDLAGGDATKNAACLRRALEGERGPHRDALVLGAALALEVAGRAGDLSTALAIAGSAIDEGRAAELLDRIADVGSAEQACGVTSGS